MFRTSRHLILSVSLCRISLKSFHAGVVSMANFDTGIEGFERNKKAYRSGSQNSLPSWLESQDYISKEEIKNLYGAFEGIVNEMVTLNCTKDLRRGNERTRELLEYVLPWAPTCAVQFLMTNKFYAEIRGKTGKLLPNEDGHMKTALKFAWILEMLAKPPFMVDDIVDEAESRNNLPRWNQVAGVGLHEVNDLCLLNTGAHYLLYKYFSQKSYFPQLIKYIMKSMYMTQVAENDLFLMTMEAKSRQSLLYTEKEVNRVKQVLNTSIYPNMPVIAGMMFNGITDPTLIGKAIELGNEVGTFILVIDDWVDCYGGEAVNEREERDILDGSLTWLLYTACRIGNEEQRKRLMAIYGKQDTASVKEVKQIYKDLKICEIILEIGEEKGRALELQISQLPQDTFPSIVWLNMLEHYRKVARGTVARV